MDARRNQAEKLDSAINQMTVLLWRLGLGKYFSPQSIGGGASLVMVHRHRVTGKDCRTSLPYIELEGEVYCLLDRQKDAAVFDDILANPQIETWLPDGWYAGMAEVVMLHEQTLALFWQAWRAMNRKSAWDRSKPKPLGVENEEVLRQASANYHLIHVVRSAARTGAGGPGDLAWIWPIAMLAVMLHPHPAVRKK